MTPALVALYVGPNSDKYLAMYAKMKEKDPNLGSLAMGWCWPVFFVPMPWLLYRKQWGIAAAIVILPYRRRLSRSRLAIGSGAIGLSSRSLPNRSMSSSRYRAFATSSRPRPTRIFAGSRSCRRVGVSVPGAIIGSIVMIAGIVVQVMYAAAEVAAVSATTTP